MKSRWNPRTITALAFGLAVLATIYFFFVRENKEELEAKSFKAIKIERGNIEVTIRSTGTIQPENRLEIKPPIAGRIEQVLVREGQRVRRGQILAWMSSTERAAVLDAARAKGAEEVARWEDLYRATPIVSPITGTLILRSVEPGQTFTSTDPILVVSDRLTVNAQVDETDLAQVKTGMGAVITLDAYPGAPIAAKVARIAFEAKTVSNITMYEVDVTPENTPETMRSGMTATVQFNVASKADVLVVPNEAIHTEGKETSVLVGEKKVPVQLGLSDGKFSEVLSGLNENDVIRVRVLGEATEKNKANNPFMPSGRRTGRGR